MKAEVEDCRELKSRLGSGSAFSDAKAATCSMLTSAATNECLLLRKLSLHIPFPDWANATSANAT